MNEDKTTSSSTSLDRLVAAWRAAASDLGVRVVSPFDVLSGGSVVAFALYLPDFGSPSGMVCSIIGMCSGCALAAKQAGYYYSSLNPEAYRHYDRAKFIDTLNDWQTSVRLSTNQHGTPAFHGATIPLKFPMAAVLNKRCSKVAPPAAEMGWFSLVSKLKAPPPLSLESPDLAGRVV